MNKEKIEQDKWNKLIKLIEYFKHIPFIDFVLVAGSMATGDIHKDSDFDLIIGAKQGRIFTVRQLTAGLFQLIGKRRKESDNKKESRNKICLNHFVTPKKYRLDPPYNEYWIYLYQNILPIHGDKTSIEEFFNVNEWAGEIDIDYDLYTHNKRNCFRRFLEIILKGWFGDIFEKIFKKYQLKRIKKGLKEASGYKPQIKINDNELRFHMDTKRVEEWIKKNNDN